jgi:S1-C subfamily serine protease
LRGFDLARGVLGDVLLAINGSEVHQLSDLTDALEELGVGAEARLTVQRGSRLREVSVAVVDISASR